MVPLTNSPQISVLKNNIGSPLLTLPVYSKSVGGSETLQEGARMREQPWSGVLLGDQQHLVLKASSQKWHMTLVLRCHWWSPATPNVKWGGGGGVVLPRAQEERSELKCIWVALVTTGCVLTQGDTCFCSRSVSVFYGHTQSGASQVDFDTPREKFLDVVGCRFWLSRSGVRLGTLHVWQAPL